MNKEDAILVTGAAGLIGSAVVWELNRRGFENIVIAEILGSDEKWRNLVPLKYASYIDANELLQNPDSPSTRDVRCIFHLGACSATTEKNADYLMRNNYAFTMQLARWALAENRRFVYASSAATYGDGSAGMSDLDPDQLHTLRPLNMYGYSKHLVDLHGHRNGWLTKITGLKYFNVFGPNEDHKGGMRSVVQGLPRDFIDRKSQPVPQSSSGLPGRRANEGFPLREGCRGGYCRSRPQSRSHGNFQCGFGNRLHMDRPRDPDFCRARTTGGDRLCRYARATPRQVPVPHPRRHLTSAPTRRTGNIHPVGRSGS
jgi:hypothetical protein